MEEMLNCREFLDTINHVCWALNGDNYYNKWKIWSCRQCSFYCEYPTDGTIITVQLHN